MSKNEGLDPLQCLVMRDFVKHAPDGHGFNVVGVGGLEPVGHCKRPPQAVGITFGQQRQDDPDNPSNCAHLHDVHDVRISTFLLHGDLFSQWCR